MHFKTLIKIFAPLSVVLLLMLVFRTPKHYDFSEISSTTYPIETDYKGRKKNCQCAYSGRRNCYAAVWVWYCGPVDFFTGAWNTMGLRYVKHGPWYDKGKLVATYEFGEVLSKK